MDAFGRIIAVILAVIMITLFPLQYIALNQNTIIDNHVHSETTEFIEEIMLQGYITMDMYNNFLYKLDDSKQLYDVEIIHSKPKQAVDINNINGPSINSKLMKTSFSYASEVKKVNENKANEKKDNEKKAEEQLRIHNLSLKNLSTSNNNIQLLATHTHSSNCYVTDEYVFETTSTCGHTLTQNATTTVPFVNFNSNNSPSPGYSFAGYKCDSCNKTIVLLNFFYNTGSSSQTIKNWIVEIPTSELYSAFAPVLNNAYNHIKNTSMITYTSDGSGHFTFFGVENAMNYMISSLKTANYSPIPTVDTVYKNYITTVSIGSNWPYNYLNITNGTKHYTIKPATPICDKVVTNITATNPSQTVNQGDSIITTATATYLDGHTGVVNCTSNYNENLGTQIVTLTYSGLVDNAKTTGTKSCSSTVITKSKDKPIGLSIIPSSSTVYNGTEPTYTVKVLYENNTSKVITSGYTKTGFTRGAGTKNVTFSYTENSITVSNTITIQVLRNLRVCPNGHSYELDDFDNDFGCPICAETIKHINVAPDYITIGLGMSLDINITITYLDEHTSLVKSGWSSNYNPNVLGKQLVTVSYKGKETTITVNVVNNILCPICGTEYAPNDDGTDPGCPICSTKVIRIEATPNNQTVHVGEGIQLEVTATFQDGHKEKVNGWTSNFSSYKVGVQTVIVVYKNITTTVYVTVESESETTCPICGTKYSIIENPNGCPVCSKIVDKIEARLRNGGTKVQYGSDLNLYVILVYRDGHREIAYNGWSIEGYQPNVLGEQTILVKYNDLLTNLTIEVVNTLSKTVCPNGHVYYLNDDGSNPGCPYCTEDNKQFPDDYFDLVYTSSILDELYKNDIYYFDVGDYITVNVIPKSFSVIQKLIKIFHLNEAVDKKFSYGGMITFGEYI